LTVQRGEKARLRSCAASLLLLSIESRSEGENDPVICGGLCRSWPGCGGIIDCGGIEELFTETRQAASRAAAADTARIRAGRTMDFSPEARLTPGNAGGFAAHDTEVRFRTGYRQPLSRNPREQ
jgi:hypothetical protein